MAVDFLSLSPPFTKETQKLKLKMTPSLIYYPKRERVWYNVTKALENVVCFFGGY